MSENTGISLINVKERNRQYIKQIIYHKAPITRKEITAELGLTLPTITTNVAHMLAQGLLVELNEPAPVRSAAGGRRVQRLDINTDAGYAVGVELGPYQTYLCITNLRGKSLCEKVAPAAPHPYEEMLAAVSAQISELVRRADLPPEKLLGVGVGVPGFIDSAGGIIRRAFDPDWQGKPFCAQLSDQLKRPVWIDNNVRIRAVGQEMFSAQAMPDTFAYFFVSKGLACPLMIRSQLLPGNNATAGEIGHSIIEPGGPVCPICGHRGCLESVAGESALLAAAAQACSAGKAPILAALLAGGEPLTMAALLEAQRLGDAGIEEILWHAVEYLGLSISNIFNFISPGLMLVDGYIFSLEQNRAHLKKAAVSNLYGLTEQEIKLEFVPYNKMEGARGAAAFVVRNCFFR